MVCPCRLTDTLCNFCASQILDIEAENRQLKTEIEALKTYGTQGDGQHHQPTVWQKIKQMIGL